MADPVGIAFAPTSATLGTAPVWVRLDDPAEDGWNTTGYTVSRGRASELDRTDTGTATIGIADKDGTFDPTNTGSVFAGNLDPLKQAAITIQNPVTSEWRHLFRGFVAEWPCDIDKTGTLGEIQVQLVDLFGLMAQMLMVPSVHGDTPPAGSEGDIYFPATGGIAQVRGRLHAACDQAGIPASWRHFFSGNVGLQEWVYARKDQLLEVMKDAADAEFPGVSNLLCSRRGTLVFRGRYARFNAEAYEADDDDLRDGPAGIGGRLCFWRAGGRPQTDVDEAVALISDLSWRRSSADIINNALATPNLGIGGGTLTDAEIASLLYTDSTSIAAYGWRSAPAMDDLLVRQGNTPPGYTAVQECGFYSEYYVENYKQPKTRITRLVFRGLPLADRAAAATWKLVCGVEIGDVIYVETTHYGGAGGFDEDYFVEGIRYTVNPAGELPDITLELDVSPRGFYTHNPWGTTVDDETDPDDDVPE